MVETKRQSFRGNVASIAPTDSASLALSFLACLWAVMVLAILTPELADWFILPVLACGVLMGADLFDWLRGRIDTLDPVGLLGLVGTHILFFAPLLHIVWDYWLSNPLAPPDWKPWLGWMAMLNAIGLVFYRVLRDVPIRRERRSHTAVCWRMGNRFWPILAGALLLSGALQLWVYWLYGGLGGYISTFEQGRSSAFLGMGRTFMVSESFPILAMMGYAVYSRKRTAARSWLALIIAFVVFFLLKMLFGGLKGSRSDVVWALFWFAGIVHFWIRPLPKRSVFYGIIVIVLFAYTFGFYKAVGTNASAAFRNLGEVSVLAEETGRTAQALTLRDFARSDLQAFILYRLADSESTYTYAWGRTYLAAAALFVPQSMWPERPPTIALEGTTIQYGNGSYEPGRWESSAVYGLAGETMLNFGPALVPVAFGLLGLAVGKVRYWTLAWLPTDVRRLLLPLLVNFTLIVLVSDSNNLVPFLVKNGLVPSLVLILAKERTAPKSPLRAEDPWGGGVAVSRAQG